jgi:hypothetical protein
MDRVPLASAFAKLKRAESHIGNLDEAIKAFIDSRPYKIVSNFYEGKQIWRFAPDCIPDDIDAIAADAVHNVRTPLDKMLTELAEKRSPKGGKRHRGIGFPSGRDADAFKAALARQEEYFAADVIEFLRDTEAYPDGKGQIIFAIHDIDLGDKHHPVLTTIKLANTSTSFGELRAIKGTILMAGSPRGQYMIPEFDPDTGARPLRQRVAELCPKLSEPSPGKFVLEFRGPHDDMIFLTTTPGAEFQSDFEPTLSVAFSEVQGFEGEPAINFLENARKAVAGVLTAFEKRFFS